MRALKTLILAVTVQVAGAVSGVSGQQPAPEIRSRGTASEAVTIHQEIDFPAPPERLYGALLDSAQFTAFSGRPAEIRREEGGAFSLFGGHIIGRNVELVPNRRIVQAWRVVDWPEGVYSIATFRLESRGSGTYLVFDHVGFPAGLRDHLAEGWESNYWSLLQKYLR